ncbi:HNH endonuclease [candidate division KSB1 bacterium]|nr:HNH endonuclease [candidate division KSB1 bacterium]
MKRVLVLNASYEPINICGMRRAVVLVLKGIACMEELSHHYLRSPSTQIQVPSVIRLNQYINVQLRRTGLSKRTVFVRDQYTCQYCGKKFDPGKLTLDHILPQSRGGKDIWENIVTACYRCNEKKADKTPSEAGLKLLNSPRQFGSYYFLQWVRMEGRMNDQWRKYLYY